MRNRPFRRVAAALLNLLFLLAWGEPVGLQPCPMHDGVGAASSTTAPTGTAAVGTVHHRAPMAMAPASGHDHGAHPQAGHACSCLGNCSASVGAVAPVAQALR